ncbi:hypothetical protein T484DRAFT_1774443, partial [Baffinella frigidus]
VQQSLCAHVTLLREALRDAVSRARSALIDVDATHAQVYMLQSLTETELRQHEWTLRGSSSSRGGPVGSPSKGNAEREAFLHKQGNAECQTFLHKQVKELEGDLKALQEELSESQMLRKEGQQDMHLLRERARTLEEEGELYRAGERGMMNRVARLEEAVADSAEQASALPYCVRLCLAAAAYKEALEDATARATVAGQIQHDVALALQVDKSNVEVLSFSSGGGVNVDKSNVEVLSFSRGDGVNVELKLTGSVGVRCDFDRHSAQLLLAAEYFVCKRDFDSARSGTALACYPCTSQCGGSRRDGDRSGKALAQELLEKAQDTRSALHQGIAGRHITAAEMHGAVAEGAARALKTSILEAQRAHTLASQDLARVTDRSNAAAAKQRAEAEAHQARGADLLGESDARLKAAEAAHREAMARAIEKERSLGLRQQVAHREAMARAVEKERSLGLRQQEAAIQALEEKREARVSAVEREATARIEEMQRSMAHKVSKASEGDHRIYQLEVELSRLRAELEDAKEVAASTERLRAHLTSACEKLDEVGASTERLRAHLTSACEKLDEVVGPELVSAVITLSNIESEIAFFHAYSMRALSIAASVAGAHHANAASPVHGAHHANAASPAADDAHRSKAMMDKDLRLLRTQLEGLSRLRLGDPEHLTEQLQDAAAAPPLPRLSPDRAARDALDRSAMRRSRETLDRSAMRRSRDGYDPVRLNTNGDSGRFSETPTTFLSPAMPHHTPSGERPLGASFAGTASRPHTIHLEVVGARNLPPGARGGPPDLYASVSLLDPANAPARFDHVQHALQNREWRVSAAGVVLLLRPQLRTSTRVTTVNPVWNESATLLRMVPAVAVIPSSDENEALRLTAAKAAQLAPIPAGAVVVLLTVHHLDPSDPDQSAVARLTYHVKPASAAVDKWLPLFREGGAPPIP